MAGATSRGGFSEADIRALVRSGSDEERAALAHRMCRSVDAGLSGAEREAAQEILRLVAADAAEMVRRALAVTLRASTLLPRDVAVRLAADVDSIALPVISVSPVFTDEDLAEIVRVGCELRQSAVAARPALGEVAVQSLAVHGCESALAAAVTNDRARFTERALATTLDRFGQSSSITTGMAFRQALPLSVTERLVDLVGEEVRRHLVDRHALSPATALRIASGARERATVDLVDQAGRAADLPGFCAHLRRQGRLTASLLLRALACGHVGFIEQALAELAQMPHHRAWLLVHDAGPLGLRAIYDKAGLPPRLLPAFRAGIDGYHQLVAEGGDLSRLQERMLERFLTETTCAPQDELDHLLERLDRIGRPSGEAQPEPALRDAA